MKSVLVLLLFLPVPMSAQENCQGSFTEYYLNSNNIRASFFPRGNKFTDGNIGAFLAPYPSGGKLSTIFASSPWLAGFDDAGNFKIAEETYPSQVNYNFNVGPLSGIGLPYPECSNFDRVWNVFFEDISLHMEDYITDFKIDDTIPSIFGWPGRGNKYFSRFNGFELPNNGDINLADFFDANGNGLYEPEKGDHPVLNYLGFNFIIPDQMMWMVFNDVDTSNHTGKRPIRTELQVTAYAFHCQDKEWLNNTVFTKYKIFNRAVTPIDSLFFGLWTDYDLGCSEDDFMGCDSTRHTEFVYNADGVDGDSGPDCSTGSSTYAAKPPVQSMTWLSHPMHSFIANNRMNEVPFDVYHSLNGLWGDGTPMRPSGDGYHQDDSLRTTRFLFHGDPRDTNSWAAINIFDQGMDGRSVSSIALGRLDPGQGNIVYTANMFHYNPGADHLDQITHMFNNVDSLLAMSWHPHEVICNPFPTCMDDDCVWPGDFDKNGVADHRDYLTWGVLNDMTGPGRNGLVSWRGHSAEDWDNELMGLNAKHADGDGNGFVNLGDLDINTENFNLTNGFYSPEAQYPQGSDIVIKGDPEMDSQGRIRNVIVRTGRTIHNVLGMTFTVEFDTALFQRQFIIPDWPDDDPDFTYYLDNDINNFVHVSFVQTDHTGIALDSNASIIRFSPFSFRLKPGKSIPDSTIIRLRNLKAIDPQGHDLQLGAEPIVIYRDGLVGIEDPPIKETIIYPNPSEGFISIQTALETEAQLYSIQGELLRHFTLSDLSEPIDVSYFPSGIYLVRIMATGESIKLVIQ